MKQASSGKKSSMVSLAAILTKLTSFKQIPRVLEPKKYCVELAAMRKRESATKMIEPQQASDDDLPQFYS
jgi:hypothetical protein